ncbi:hypothetical protein ACFLIM_30950 [Nonomuraea sp. M3C6]|uniref:Uncharacterized protein n=1 Tax=Nonomuraea marmarensis TaxID=3351344 RepID=A0ABW7AJS9_9ACTN
MSRTPRHGRCAASSEFQAAGAARRTVSRTEFAAMSRGMPLLDDRTYREDMDRHVNDDLYDPYDRALGRSEFTEDER